MKKKHLMTVEVTQKGNRITTSIKIDPEILKEAKHLAIEQNKTFSELMEEALKKMMSKTNSSSK